MAQRQKDVRQVKPNTITTARLVAGVQELVDAGYGEWVPGSAKRHFRLLKNGDGITLAESPVFQIAAGGTKRIA